MDDALKRTSPKTQHTTCEMQQAARNVRHAHVQRRARLPMAVDHPLTRTSPAAHRAAAGPNTSARVAMRTRLLCGHAPRRSSHAGVPRQTDRYNSARLQHAARDGQRQPMVQHARPGPCGSRRTARPSRALACACGRHCKGAERSARAHLRVHVLYREDQLARIKHNLRATRPLWSHIWNGAHRCHICTGTGLTAATSAPGLGSSLPHLHRDWAHRCHICTGTGLTAATSGRTRPLRLASFRCRVHKRGIYPSCTRSHVQQRSQRPPRRGTHSAQARRDVTRAT